MSVTTKELTVLVAKKANLPKKAAKDSIKVFLNGIRDSLKRGEKVVLTGFGTFSIRSRKEKKGRNPKTGESLMIAARKAPGFTPGKSLKRSVK
jgi:nucleoid DNA-binding protein